MGRATAPFSPSSVEVSFEMTLLGKRTARIGINADGCIM